MIGNQQLRYYQRIVFIQGPESFEETLRQQARIELGLNQAETVSLELTNQVQNKSCS